MKFIKSKNIILGLFLASLFVGAFGLNVSYAQETDPTKDDFQIVNCGGYDKDGKEQKECDFKDLLQLAQTIMRFAVFISASIATLSFAYAGFLYLTAFGNSGKVEQAKGVINKVLVGVFFVLAGFLLVGTILKTLGVQQAFSLLNTSDIKPLEK